MSSSTSSSKYILAYVLALGAAIGAHAQCPCPSPTHRDSYKGSMTFIHDGSQWRGSFVVDASATGALAALRQPMDNVTTPTILDCTGGGIIKPDDGSFTFDADDFGGCHYRAAGSLLDADEGAASLIGADSETNQSN